MFWSVRRILHGGNRRLRNHWLRHWLCCGSSSTGATTIATCASSSRSKRRDRACAKSHLRTRRLSMLLWCKSKQPTTDCDRPTACCGRAVATRGHARTPPLGPRRRCLRVAAASCPFLRRRGTAARHRCRQRHCRLQLVAPNVLDIYRLRQNT